MIVPVKNHCIPAWTLSKTLPLFLKKVIFYLFKFIEVLTDQGNFTKWSTVVCSFELSPFIKSFLSFNSQSFLPFAKVKL